MFSPSSALLSTLFSSSSPPFPPPHLPSNSAFAVPSSAASPIVSASTLSDAIRAFSLQLLLDQHRNSLLRSILSLTPTVPVTDIRYSNSVECSHKIESPFEGDDDKQKKKGAEGRGEEEWRESAEDEKMEKERPRGKKRTRKEREETRKERKRSRKEGMRRKVFRLQQKGETETDSPVSGMFIREFCDEEELRQATAELDESASCVRVTEEKRMAVNAIPNVIGESICALCKIRFGDVFRLAMHKCPRIRHEEYRCNECEKVFSCPANLASHRRWHRPNATSRTDRTKQGKRAKTKANAKVHCNGGGDGTERDGDTKPSQWGRTEEKATKAPPNWQLRKDNSNGSDQSAV